MFVYLLFFSSGAFVPLYYILYFLSSVPLYTFFLNPRFLFYYIFCLWRGSFDRLFALFIIVASPQTKGSSWIAMYWVRFIFISCQICYLLKRDFVQAATLLSESSLCQLKILLCISKCWLILFVQTSFRFQGLRKNLEKYEKLLNN